MLFSKGPFISIFASDPHIIIKAVNQNLNSVLRDSNINGHDYMRNIIHLPVFLNSRGLSTAKRLCISTPANADQLNSDGWYKQNSEFQCAYFYEICKKYITWCCREGDYFVEQDSWDENWDSA